MFTNRYIPDDVEVVERNGKLFFAHFKNRYDPISIGLMAVAAFGVLKQMQGTRQAGKNAEEIAEQRAAVALENDKAVREAAVEEARIKREKGIRLLKEQKGSAAAANILINKGAPLVIETETNDLLAKDIGFGLERGRAEADAFTHSAGIEIAAGKAAKKKSSFDAMSQGLIGFSSIAFMGIEGGVFSKAPNVGPVHKQGVFHATTGKSLEGFGRSFIS